TPQGDAGARSHGDRPMAPMFLAELILVTDVGVATIGMAAVRHGLSTVRHRQSQWPEGDPGGRDHRDALREVELRGWRWDPPLEGVSAPRILVRGRTPASVPKPFAVHAARELGEPIVEAAE